jgi:hypothetical protein
VAVGKIVERARVLSASDCECTTVAGRCDDADFHGGSTSPVSVRLAGWHSGVPDGQGCVERIHDDWRAWSAMRSCPPTLESSAVAGDPSSTEWTWRGALVRGRSGTMHQARVHNGIHKADFRARIAARPRPPSADDAPVLGERPPNGLSVAG